MATLADETPIRLRPHHLGGCIHTFVGNGYSADFVENFKRVARHLSARPQGVVIEIVAGPDDICRPAGQTSAHKVPAGLSAQTPGLPSQNHCASALIAERDAVALRDFSTFLTVFKHAERVDQASRQGDKVALQAGSQLLLTAAMVANFRDAYGAATGREKSLGEYPAPRRACRDCGHKDVCNQVVTEGYRGTYLLDDRPRRFALTLIT
jgi:hypothetical protein